MKKGSELKSRKQITIGVCILSLCFMLFVMVKGICLFYYSSWNSEKYRIDEELDIKYDGGHSNVSLDSLNIKLPEEFIENNIYCSDLDKDNCLNFYLDGNLDNSYITIYKTSSILNDETEELDSIDNAVELLNSFNINNEADLYNYYFDHVNLPVTIFNSMEKMQVSYLVNSYVSFKNVGDTIYKLCEDINGYMYEDDMTYFMYLYDDNDKYIVELVNRDGNAYFIENIVMDILESIYFR